jgi:hypothetical protein
VGSKSSFSFYRRHISDERYHVVSRAKVAVTDSAAVVGALLTPIAANRPDALSAKALVVAGEPGHYKELLGILPVENVTVVTGEAVLDILTRLNEIDRLIQDMIAFLNQAGTSETMADLMDRTESRLATNLRLLDEFHSARDVAAVERREWLGGRRARQGRRTGSHHFEADQHACVQCRHRSDPGWSIRPGLRRGGFRSQRRRRHARETDCDHVSSMFYAAHDRWPRWGPRSGPKHGRGFESLCNKRVLCIVGSTDCPRRLVQAKIAQRRRIVGELQGDQRTR